MAANGGIAIAKFVAYLVTGSASMLAESIHSVADTSNQGLLLLGGKRAQRVADDKHQFGYGRERYFWAFVVAMVLFALGGLFSIYEGIEKIRHPHELESLGWAVGVLVLCDRSRRVRIADVRSSKSLKVKGDRSWVDFIRRSRSPRAPGCPPRRHGSDHWSHLRPHRCWSRCHHWKPDLGRHRNSCHRDPSRRHIDRSEPSR